MDTTALVRLLVAAALTAVIGVDRELRSKPAGLRTNIVVGIATATFAYTGMALFDGGDPTRVAAQVVSGIGFLGGGAIFAAGGKPHGLTTAAALWSSAAIGLAAGVGSYGTAVALVIVTLLALWPLDLVAERILAPRVRRDVRVHLVTVDVGTLEQVQQAVAEHALQLRRLELHDLREGLGVELVVTGRHQPIAELIDELRTMGGVQAIAQEAFEHFTA